MTTYSTRRNACLAGGVLAALAVFQGATDSRAAIDDFRNPGDSVTVADLSFTSTSGEVAGDSVALVGDVVRAGGDVVADGLPDVLIGAPEADALAGRSYLVTGNTIMRHLASSTTTMALSDSDYVFLSESAPDRSGAGLSGGGDVNGDGRDDLFIGAPWHGGFPGKAYLVLGRACYPGRIVHVNGLTGNPAGPGGQDCPFSSIQTGVDTAAREGLTQVTVHGWFYGEIVTLQPNIVLTGESQNICLVPRACTSVPPTLYSVGLPPYILYGADNATVQDMILLYRGAQLDGVNAMTLERNVFYGDCREEHLLDLTGGAGDNIALDRTNLARTTAIQFVDPIPTGFDYHLQSTSRCADRGDPSTTYYDTDGTRNDMGAYGGPDPLMY